MDAIFLTNQKDIVGEIPGGVQLCSMEFHESLKLAGFILHDVYVDVSKRISDRLKRKLNLDAYQLYDPEAYVDQLTALMKDISPKFVFINKSELIRFSKIIKDIDESIPVIILSHGNETGDYLHMLTRPSKIHPIRNKLVKIYRLGYNLYIESYYRTKYVDATFTLSHVEEEIEKWLGVQNTFMVPRRFKPNIIDWKPEMTCVGFVGTLNHPPNYLGLTSLAKDLLKINSECKIKLIGGPSEFGKDLEKEYLNINYLGRLSNEELTLEMRSWSFFLNPVLWYSRGASTKLAVGVNAGLPIISSKAGNRGHTWSNGSILECGSSYEMAVFIDNNYNNLEKLKFLSEQVKKVAVSGPTEVEISDQMKNLLLNMTSEI